MRKLLVLLLAFLPAGALAQGFTSPSHPIVLCRNNTDLTNTGAGTSENSMFTCTVPAGRMGPNSSLEVHASGSQGAANTGTCRYFVSINDNTGGFGWRIIDSTGAPANRLTWMHGSCANRNSLSSQTCSGVAIWNFSGNVPPAQTITYNTANQFYVQFSITNSVAADSCTFSRLQVILWP
jgi:hypothetical protein